MNHTGYAPDYAVCMPLQKPAREQEAKQARLPTVKALSNMELRWRSLSIMYCLVASKKPKGRPMILSLQQQGVTVYGRGGSTGSVHSVL